MTANADNPLDQREINDPFAPLYLHTFMLLTTFRKDGSAMPTTVWFAHDQGKLYVMTTSNAGKAKRIRNNGLVILAPSDRVGNVLGAEIKARAREVSPEEREHARAILAAKYKEEFEQFYHSPLYQSIDRTFIEFIPV